MGGELRGEEASDAICGDCSSSAKMYVLAAEVARVTRSAAARGDVADLVRARKGWGKGARLAQPLGLRRGVKAAGLMAMGKLEGTVRTSKALVAFACSILEGASSSWMDIAVSIRFETHEGSGRTSKLLIAAQ